MAEQIDIRTEARNIVDHHTIMCELEHDDEGTELHIINLCNRVADAARREQRFIDAGKCVAIIEKYDVLAEDKARAASECAAAIRGEG